MANIGDLVATASLDIAPFEGSIKQLKMSTKGLDNMLRTVEKSVKGQGDKLSGLKSTYAQTGQSLTAYQTLLDKQSKKYNDLRSSIGDINNATAKQREDLIGARNAMAETANKVTDLQNKYSALGREIAIQSSVFTKAGNSLQTFGNNLNSISATTGKVASATRGMSLVIGAGMGYGIKQASEFNNSMTATQALLADTVPANQMNAVITKLGDNSKKWAMEYGLSTKSVNEGMQELVKAGYDANQVTASMPAILNASKASGEDFNTVMEATSSILSQYGLGAKEAGRVTDSLSFVANKTKAGFKDMGDAMVYVGPVAKSVGMDLEQTASAIGILSNAGIQGEQAGTALRGALTRLLKPSEQNAEAMKELGFSAEEFKKGQIGLPDVIDRIKKSTEGLTDAEKASLIAKAFGTESQTAMNALVNEGSDALRGLTEETKGATGYTKELAKAMNSTDAAKFAQAKAKMEVLAITIGQKLLPVIVPLVEDVADLASKFADLPEPVQKNILYLGLFLGAISPIAGVVSKTTGLLGGLSGGFGKVLSAMGKIGAEKGAVTALASVATGAETATASTVGLTGAVGLLTNPVTWGVILGGAAVLAIGLIADNMRKAHQRTQEWGTEVSEVEANHLSKLKTKVDETTQSMTAFTGSADGVDDVKTAFKGLVDEIERLQNKDLAKDLKLAEKYGLTDEQIQRMRDNASQVKENAQKMSDEVVKIYKNASKNHRELSEEEKEIVLNNQTELINKQLELMNFSKEERKNIQKAMNGDYENLNTEQLSKTLDTTKKWLSEENKAYKQSKEELKELLKAGGLTQQEYNEKLATLEAEHQAKMEAYGEKYISIRKKMAETSTKYLSPEAEKTYWNAIEQEMDKLGLSYDELQTKIKGFADSAEQTSGMTAKSMANMTDEMTSANLAWNTMVLDPKTGEIKTNAQEEIQKALQAEGGWESMQFVLKNANLETNAKISIGEALVANDQWNSLTPEEKRLVTDGSPAIEAILSSKETLSQWNSMPEEVKKILGSNEQFLSSAEGAKTALSSWNMMTPAQKALTAQNLTGPDVTVAQQTVNSLTGKNVSLDARNNTLGNVLQANANVNSVRQNSPAPIYANNQTWSGVEGARRSIASVEGRSVDIWVNLKKGASSLWNAIGWATGTNYHPGGLAVVNDQKGSTYRELVTLPNGNSFIPEGRDVMLPLPKGTKVLKASDTKKLFPQYADGVGFEDTRIARLTERMRSIPEEKITATYQSDNSEVKQLLTQLLALTGRGTELMSQIVRGVNELYDKESYMVLDDGTLVAETGNKFAKHFSSIERRNKRLRGKPYD